MLEQVHDALWIAEGVIVSFFGIAYSTRSVIARLRNGDLWVWSPVKLTAALRTEVDRLGPVRHLVSPTRDQACAPLEWRLSFINRAPARRARDKVLSWNCRRVIVAHGEWPRANGNAFLAKSFRWLGA